MKAKHLLIALSTAALTACVKTNDLYKINQYNSPIFDENYYVEYDGLDELNLTEKTIEKNWSNPDGSFSTYGYGKELSKVSDEFKKGYLSKLYDGRTWCDEHYQLSRVQVDSSGFGTKLPLKLKTGKRFEFAARGGTSPTISKLEVDNLLFDITITFYTETTKVNYLLKSVNLTTDSGGITTLVSFELDNEASGAIGYSFKYKCLDTTDENTTDNYLDKEKDHLAIMLYEVMLPDSTWF